MKKLIASIIFLLVLTGSACALDVSSWNTKNSDHFIVYYRNAPSDYVDRVIATAESCYTNIDDKLGFTRFDNFWTWDKRVSIYLFDNEVHYSIYSGQPTWSVAGTESRNRRIYTFVSMNNFFEGVLPHEICHIIFYDFVLSKKAIPLWMLEGIACYVEKSGHEERLKLAREYARSGIFISLGGLSNVNRLNDSVDPSLFYSESAAVVEFLIDKYGKSRFFDFCRGLRDLRPDEGWSVALKNCYGFKDISELFAAYIRYIS